MIGFSRISMYTIAHVYMRYQRVSSAVFPVRNCKSASCRGGRGKFQILSSHHANYSTFKARPWSAPKSSLKDQHDIGLSQESAYNMHHVARIHYHASHIASYFPHEVFPSIKLD